MMLTIPASPVVPASGEALFATLTPAQRFAWLLRSDVRGPGIVPDRERLADFLGWWLTVGLTEYPSIWEPPTGEQVRFLRSPRFAATRISPPISHLLAQVWRRRTDVSAVLPYGNLHAMRGFGDWILL